MIYVKLWVTFQKRTRAVEFVKDIQEISARQSLTYKG